METVLARMTAGDDLPFSILSRQSINANHSWVMRLVCQDLP